MRYLLLVVLMVSWTPIYGQTDNFTGLIVYEYQFQNPLTGTDLTEQVAQYLGREQHYFINAKNYKGYDENGNISQLYNSKTNKYYFINPTTGQLTEKDAAKSNEEIISIQHFDETEYILGQKCNKLIVETDSKKTIYWYSPQIKVDPRVYKNHKLGGWSAYMKASAGALPLKYIVKTTHYNLISTAKEIKEMYLTDKDFDLEKNTD